MSYPKGKTAVTCYAYEPWHYRYVGRDKAALYEYDITARQREHRRTDHDDH
jgi:D-alanyl-D-alanine carboxypeptidase